jgi:hypothetical protein
MGVNGLSFVKIQVFEFVVALNIIWILVFHFIGHSQLHYLNMITRQTSGSSMENVDMKK